MQFTANSIITAYLQSLKLALRPRILWNRTSRRGRSLLEYCSKQSDSRKRHYCSSVSDWVSSVRSTNVEIKTANRSIFNVNYDLKRFWELKSFGISTLKDESLIGSHLQEYQETSSKFKNGRYSAKLPPPLDNYSVARRRTQNTIRRLQEQPSLFQKYVKLISDQEKRGFIEKVALAQPDQNVHDIPYRGVTKESATTPIP